MFSQYTVQQLGTIVERNTHVLYLTLRLQLLQVFEAMQFHRILVSILVE